MTILWVSLRKSTVPELDYIQICRKTLFPFYVLRSDNIYFEDGLLFLNGKIIDDRNQKGDTMGKRRLQTPHKLASLGKSIFDFIQLIDSKETKFVDSRGFCFYYVKTKLCEVISFQISKKLSKGTHTTLFLKGVNCPFSISYYPTGKDWGQVLMLDGLPWKLVSVSENKLNTYKRKI